MNGADGLFAKIRRRPLVAIGIVAVVIIIAVLLSGCARQRLGLELADPDVYTRADVDAINAEAACKMNARTPLQLARCSTRR